MTGREHVGRCKEAVPSVSWSGCWSECVHFPILPGSPRTVPANEVEAELGFQGNLWQGADSRAGTSCLLPTCPTSFCRILVMTLAPAAAILWAHGEGSRAEDGTATLQTVPGPGGLELLPSGILTVFSLVGEKWFTFDDGRKAFFPMFITSCFNFCLSLPSFVKHVYSWNMLVLCVSKMLQIKKKSFKK